MWFVVLNPQFTGQHQYQTQSKSEGEGRETTGPARDKKKTLEQHKSHPPVCQKKRKISARKKTHTHTHTRTSACLSVCHDGVDVGVRDGSVLATENLIGPEPQRIQQLLLAQLI